MAEAKRVTHARKVYVYEDDTTGRSAKPNWKTLRFELIKPEKDAEGNLVVCDTVDIPRDTFLPEILDCGAGHGLMQKIGDDLAGLATKAKADQFSPDPETGFAEYIKQRIADMLDNFAAGVWITESEGKSGANVTILLDAMMRAFSDSGMELSEEQVAGIREKLKDEKYRSDAQAMPAVKAYVEEIKLERAKERAKAAKEAAKDAGASDMSALI